jgi:cytochrome b561
MLLLLMLHIGAALKHQFLDRQPELSRMTVRRKR